MNKDTIRQRSKALIKKGVLIRPDCCEVCNHRPNPQDKSKQIVIHHYNGYDAGDEFNVWFVCHSCNIALGSRTDLAKEQAQKLAFKFNGRKGFLRRYLAQGLSYSDIMSIN